MNLSVTSDTPQEPSRWVAGDSIMTNRFWMGGASPPCETWCIQQANNDITQSLYDITPNIFYFKLKITFYFLTDVTDLVLSWTKTETRFCWHHQNPNFLLIGDTKWMKNNVISVTWTIWGLRSVFLTWAQILLTKETWCEDSSVAAHWGNAVIKGYKYTKYK